jgi:hypothetical protein
MPQPAGISGSRATQQTKLHLSFLPMSFANNANKIQQLLEVFVTFPVVKHFSSKAVFVRRLTLLA